MPYHPDIDTIETLDRKRKTPQGRAAAPWDWIRKFLHTHDPERWALSSLLSFERLNVWTVNVLTSMIIWTRLEIGTNYGNKCGQSLTSTGTKLHDSNFITCKSDFQFRATPTWTSSSLQSVKTLIWYNTCHLLVHAQNQIEATRNHWQRELLLESEIWFVTFGIIPSRDRGRDRFVTNVELGFQCFTRQRRGYVESNVHSVSL